MQTRSLSLIALAIAAIFFASCNKSNTQGKLIPKNASIVVQVDGKNLSSKLSWDDIKQNPLFKEASADSTLPATVKSILDNPENSGIDTKTDLLFFLQKDSVGGYIGFEGTIKDESKFKTFNKDASKDGALSEKDGISYISHSPLCVGWTKEKFVYVFDVPQLGQMDELTRRIQANSIDIGSSISHRDIAVTCQSVFALKESGSLGKDEKFSNLMKEQGDIRFWMNSEELYKGAATSAALAMFNLDKLYKGSITTATINFDNGKINLNSSSYASAEMTKLYKKYGGGKINEDMIKRMPGKNVLAVMAFNFKPEGIKELIKMTNMDGLLNIGLTAMGFNMDDFIKANKGDIMFGLSDLQIKKDTVKINGTNATGTISGDFPSFNAVFAASIGDKDAFNKLIAAGKKIGGEKMTDGEMPPIAYNTNGNYFALSNTKENVDKFLAGSNTNNDFISKISGQAFGGYINIQGILKTFESEAAKDSSGKAIYDASIKFWGDIIWKGGDMKGDAITQSMEVNLLDKTTNSLKQLNQYASTLSSLYMEHEKRRKENSGKLEEVKVDNPGKEEPPTSSAPQKAK